ncbi:MFS transporter [Halobellus limi]|uniref:MFS transporter n=1 Tax=Halobellus limi TaxID=699433 RepID=UPI0010A3E250|nr:MFS transporter [Halobellus limi]
MGDTGQTGFCRNLFDAAAAFQTGYSQVDRPELRALRNRIARYHEFLSGFLQFEKGFAPTVASYSFSGFFLVRMVANPLAGRLGDRPGYPTVATGVGVCASSGLLAATLLDARLGVAAAGLTKFWPVIHAYAFEHLRNVDRGDDFRAMRTVYVGIGLVYVGVVAGGSPFRRRFSA